MSGLNPWLLLFSVAAVAIALSLTWVSLADRLMPGISPEHNSKISPYLSVTGLVYGALLGFTVVVSWQEFSAAQAVVVSEATSLTTLYRQTTAMPEPERAQLRALLRTYTADEGADWERQPGASRRPTLVQIYRVVGDQPPSAASNPINGAFLSELTELASHRTMRHMRTQPRIPPPLWAGLGAGALVLITLTALLRIGNTAAHGALTSMVAILLGLLLWIVFTLDHPSGGEITSGSLQHALLVFDVIDRST
ncbi:bestrophin-like domain [Mycobacterium sp. Marseille-P9652]|uniref:bestrophin-like domain n=1 Tax=Mycobacterium sp. Marseille-P9652 TaxID=2654950 RepID=UPI0012E79CE3|nr:DUF4239 domain-containing protein [Mycobacterium sp. Marseille-P9652]